MHSLIGHLHMQCFLVCIGINSNSFNAHFVRRLNDATGNFTTVSYKDFVKHRFGSACTKLKRNVAVLAPRILEFLFT